MYSDEIKEELQQKGIKNTRVKGILLKILKESHSPIDANKLHKECEKESHVNLVSVYRTLKQFHEKKIVQEFVRNDGVIQYEYIRQGSKAHPHFQCEKCHNVFCLDELGFDDALYFSNMAKHHQIHSINITLNGVCERCQ